MSEALNGIRVLELGGRAVSLAGRMLADLGAEVILVEPPAGASARTYGAVMEGLPPEEASYAHQYFNANKRSVILDIATSPDRFLDLVGSADVLLEHAAPDWLPGLGLDHATLRAHRPGLVHCSVTPFGRDTPWAGWRANDLVSGAAGGLIQVSGSPSGTPVQGGASPSYTMSSLAAASAVSIALHQRDAADGVFPGVHIDLSMQEATALAVMQTACPVQWRWFQNIPRRPGLSAAMPCKDGKYVGLLVRPDRFQQFLAWADRVGIDHGMTQDDWHYARLESPRQGNPVAETTLALAAALTRDEFVDGALEADIVCLPVLDFPDLEKQEQYRANDQFLDVHHDVLNTDLGFVRSPVDAMADGVEIRRAPTLGEHQDLLETLNTSRPGDSAPETQPDPATALQGLRVVDFGWVLAAPIGTRLLASFGAEVIRVESTVKPDSMRSQFGPEGRPDPDLGGLFNTVNAGKKSFTVDVTKPEGLELVKALIATADVVVNNFRPDAMERMGLGYDVLQSLKPDIILLNLPGAHRVGPWAQRASMGNILMAASGFNMLTGFEGERPRGIGVAYPDFTSPHLLVTTVLAAVRQRQATGRGQELHLTQLSAVLAILGAEWMQYKATGQQPPRNGNRHENYAPHGVYPAAKETDPEIDAWVAIAVDGDESWQALCEVIHQPGLADDPRFGSHADRKANEDELDQIIRQWTAERDKWEVASNLQAAGVAAAPVEHLKDMLDRDPQLHRHYQTVRQPGSEVDIPVQREAARWVGMPLELQRSPLLGEHSAYVVQDILGVDDVQFAELLAADVIS